MNAISIVENSAVKAIISANQDSQLNKAVRCFISRQNRDAHPDGSSDRAKRWVPAAHEKCECCTRIRTPSRSFPLSLLTHCCTIIHIANLFDVDKSTLRQAVNNYKKSLKVNQD
ncbi:MAG: hypothetical protein WC742_10330 [Gallionellaceae bacterium]|jgi:hypothetical protein